MAVGMHSIYAVFGSEDGYRILRPLIQNTIRPPIEVYLDHPSAAANKLLGLLLDHLVHWRLYVGLPLITPMLILSRTKLADSILPVLPVLFFATQAHPLDEHLDFTRWPPSASLCFAVLPYIRSAYNLYYDKVWAEKEKRWLKEIHPRSGAAQGDADGGQDDGVLPDGLQADDEDENVFEVRIDGGIWDDWEEPPPQEAQHLPPARPPLDGPQQAPPLNQPPLQDRSDAAAEPPPNIPDNRAQARRADIPNANPQLAPQQQQPQANPQPPAANNAAAPPGGERRLSFSPTAIAETVLGAILFPTIAGLSGELLQVLLPRAWTVRPAAAKGLLGDGGARPFTGLLQHRWGRSLVGGCLFVVAKDAVMLYVRWRMAQMHRNRRVLDYGGRRSLRA
jgi:hypothetical protein